MLIHIYFHIFKQDRNVDIITVNITALSLVYLIITHVLG